MRGRSGCSGWTPRRAPRRSAGLEGARARTHPDRNAERAGAATRVTAAFNQARELCEWWLEAGEPWPKPMPPEALRTPEPERVVRPPARTPEQNRSSFRAGDLVARVVPGREAAQEPVLSVRASGPGEDGRVELEDGSSAAPGDLAPVAYGCPCAGSAAARPSSGPRCARARSASRSSCGWSAPSARSSRRCEASARAPAPAARRPPSSADSGLEELARERFRWAESVGRRPREERRGRILAAYAHAYALWAAGSTARDADNARAASG